jgi:hypothetical protein
MTEEEFHNAISKQEHLDSINEIYLDTVRMSDYGENLFKLTIPQKSLYFIIELDIEVVNGGFNQYFFNSGGDNAEEALKALKEIGAEKSASITKQAFDLWPNETVPKDRFTRQDLLEDVEIYADATWEKLDDAFCEDKEKVISILFQYILNNSNMFYR